MFTIGVLLVFPGISLASERDDLLGALQNTLENDARVVGNYDISAQMNEKDILSVHSDVRSEYKKNGNFWGAEDFSVTFDIPDFGSGFISLSGYAEYSNITKRLLTGITKMSGVFPEDQQKIAGMFEMAKIFSGNEFLLDLQEMQEFDPQIEITQNIFSNYSDFSVKILGIAIDSGALIISETPEGYRLTLNRDAKQWKPEVLALALEELGAPDFMIESFKSMDTESQKVFREELSSFLDHLEISLDIGVDGADITSFAASLSADFSQESWDFLDDDFVSKTDYFSVNFSSKMSLVSEIKPLEKPKMTIVSLAKILKSFQEDFFTPNYSSFESDSDYFYDSPDSPYEFESGLDYSPAKVNSSSSRSSSAESSISLPNGAIKNRQRSIIRY